MGRFRVALVMLCVLVSGFQSAGYAKSAGISLVPYLAIRGSQKVDDRCHLLTPDQRKLVDDYFTQTLAQMRKQDPNFSFDDSSLVGANNMSCDQGKSIVMNVYGDSVGFRRTTIMLSMKVGERCRLLSSGEDGRLHAAIHSLESQATEQLGQGSLGDLPTLDQRIEQKSLEFSCADARPNLDNVLKSLSAD